MIDMLVRLYALPDLRPVLAEQQSTGVTVRRALAPEKRQVVAWVAEAFHSLYWISECEIAFTRQPVACFIAIEQGKLVGFACYDATCRNFFGPTGVSEAHRGRGIGRALLLATLHDMAAQGYAYAIIGAVELTEFYARTVGAVEIEGSDPGIYQGVLRD